MNHLRNFIIGMMLFAVIFLLGCTTTNSSEIPQKEPSNPAPDFELNTLDGKVITKQDFENEVVLLQAFAAWCSTCIQEAKHIQEIQKEVGPELKVVWFDLQSGETQGQIENFISRSGVEKEAWDWAFYNSEIGIDYKARSLEATYVIDRNGNIAYSDQGYTLPDYSTEIIREIVEDAT